jgi:uncharacterized damage-inducible protein DinB
MLYSQSCSRLPVCFDVLVSGFSIDGNSKPMTHTEIEQRVAGLEDEDSKSLLIGGCTNCIAQCDQILSIILQENFTDDSKGSSSIGAHVRHILDRFHCFFAGIAGASIDYDARKRDPEIEQNVEAAMFALESVARRIEQLRSLPFCSELIGVKESVLSSSPAVEISSTLERELMGLITHSIHHLAIIALLAKSFGYQMDSDLGKAPSTIVYERA